MRWIIPMLALSACSSGTVVTEKVERVSVPVAVGCVSGERPAMVAPLKERFTADQWAALTPKQKSANVAAQGLKHQNRAQMLDSATGACR